eukprot:scaffold1225_cov164-Amphora_coffeaeformis.AAC.8
MESGERKIEGGGSQHHEPNTQHELQPQPPSAPTSSNNNNSSRHKPSDRHETRKDDNPTTTTTTTDKDCCGAMQDVSWNDVFYIAAFGILGAVARVYIGRIFGGDCEQSEEGAGDFWQASRICITANGLTDRRGGALFLDLPANVVGSFCMGLLSASAAHPIPWLRKDHHLQRQTSWHKGLTTGFCGCLTTCKFILRERKINVGEPFVGS